MRDDRGQMILVGGFLIAFGLVAITVMLNSIIYTGNIAYVGTMDASDNDLFYLQDLTVKESNNAYNDANFTGTFNPESFNRYMNNYSSSVSKIYAYKGASARVADISCDPVTKQSSAHILYSKSNVNYDYNTASIGLQPTPLPTVSPPPLPGGTPTRLLAYSDKIKIVGNNIEEAVITVQLMDDSGHSIPKDGVTITLSATSGSPGATSLVTDPNGKASTIFKSDTPGISSITATSPGLLSSTVLVTVTEVPQPSPPADSPLQHNMAVSISTQKLSSTSVKVTATVQNTGSPKLENMYASLLINTTHKKYKVSPSASGNTQSLPPLQSNGDMETVSWTVYEMADNKDYTFQVLVTATCANDHESLSRFSDRVDLITPW